MDDILELKNENRNSSLQTTVNAALPMKQNANSGLTLFKKPTLFLPSLSFKNEYTRFYIITYQTGEIDHFSIVVGTPQ